MNSLSHKIHSLSLLFNDIALFYLSLLVALLLRYGQLNASLWQQHWPVFTGLLALWLIIFYAFNLYESYLALNKMDFFGNYAKAGAINIALSILYFYVLAPQTNLAPKTILVILFGIFSLAFFLTRSWLVKITNSARLRQNVLFIGYEQLLQELLPKNQEDHNFGYNFKGVISNASLPDLNLRQYPLEKLREVLQQEKINLVVVNQPNDKEIINLLFQALPLRINFISLTNFYEQITQRIPLKIISHGWFLDNFSEGNKEILEFSKRFLDIIISLTIGGVSLALTPFIAMAIALNSKGGVMFKQIRVGKDGQPFLALKFRTMYQNAEGHGPMWASANDPRVTTVGRFLRTTRLDEIPQLINILKGEMSFVGPRPERPEFIDQLIKEIPFYKERLLVKPGLTGWAQIKMPYADSVESSLKKLQYDLYYIKHRSLLFDFSVILKTINIILQKLGR